MHVWVSRKGDLLNLASSLVPRRVWEWDHLASSLVPRRVWEQDHLASSLVPRRVWEWDHLDSSLVPRRVWERDYLDSSLVPRRVWERDHLASSLVPRRVWERDYLASSLVPRRVWEWDYRLSRFPSPTLLALLKNRVTQSVFQFGYRSRWISLSQALQSNLYCHWPDHSNSLRYSNTLFRRTCESNLHLCNRTVHRLQPERMAVWDLD